MHLRPRPGLERRRFTAIDVAGRVAVLSVRSCATAGTARDHLADLIARIPFPIRAIQVDGGFEFMGEVELACRDAGIPLYVLSPPSPKLNGSVERLNRTVREEFWDCHRGPVDLATLQPALRAWGIACNTDRPHPALGYVTPMDYLHSHDFSDVSNSYTGRCGRQRPSSRRRLLLRPRQRHHDGAFLRRPATGGQHLDR